MHFALFCLVLEMREIERSLYSIDIQRPYKMVRPAGFVV